MRASCQPLVLHSTHIFIDVEGEEVATHFRIRFSGPAIPLMIVADFVDQTPGALQTKQSGIEQIWSVVCESHHWITRVQATFLIK